MFPCIEIIRYPNPVDYSTMYQAMREHTLQRTEETPDAVWLAEHFPVFTQGQAGKPEHLLAPGNIPVVQSDRGGQVTYHGPGQLMIYTLCDLKRLGLGLSPFVRLLEQTMMTLLQHYGLQAHTEKNKPGIYIKNAKICSLGLRLRHQRSYHGLSLNVKMDLEPFTRINPCGFAQMKMTQVSDFIPDMSLQRVINDLIPLLHSALQPQRNNAPIPVCGGSHE